MSARPGCRAELKLSSLPLAVCRPLSPALRHPRRAGHHGPVILAGDFNTWSDARDRVVVKIAARLGLTELRFGLDQRSTFIGRHVDHIFVRGLQLIDIRAIPVTSSDHNPIEVTMRIAQ